MIYLLYVYQYSFTGDYYEALFIVLDKIGNDWSKLVTFLDATIDVAVVRNENPNSVFDQGREALKEWSQKHPTDVTVANLEKGLKAIGRNDIIIAIKESNQ